MGFPGGCPRQQNQIGTDRDTYIAFAAIAFLLVASPGPNLFLLVKNAPVLGIQTGLLNVAGICIAILCHATLSLIGVSAIVLGLLLIGVGTRLATLRSPAP
jgi:hypothetical protein